LNSSPAIHTRNFAVGTGVMEPVSCFMELGPCSNASALNRLYLLKIALPPKRSAYAVKPEYFHLVLSATICSAEPASAKRART